MFSLQQQLEAQEDFYSRQDAIRERYACQIEDARREALIEQEMHDYYDKVWNAGFGTDVYKISIQSINYLLVNHENR